MATTVVLVDDHPIVRSGLRAVLGADPRLEVLADVSTGEEALAVVEATSPQVVLCDVRLGEGMNGIETTRVVRAMKAAPAVVILSTYDRDADIFAAAQAGAAGYLLKDVAPERIADAVVDVARGGTCFAPELAGAIVRGAAAARPQLTTREVEVLALVGKGASNAEIARELFVSEATIKSHLVHIFSKLDVTSRSRAVFVARETGLIS